MDDQQGDEFSNNINMGGMEKDQNYNKMERFAKLSEKINALSKASENKDPRKYEKIESKINEVEDNFNTNLDSLEQKYNILKEQIGKFAKMIEEDRLNKEKAKNKNSEDLKIFEGKIKEMMLEEREFLKNYVDSAVSKIEELINNYDKESKDENDAIKATVEELKNYMNVELPNLNAKIEEENEERINNIKTLVDQMNQQFGEVHELIDNERKKREESENNFVQNLEEIMNKVKNEFNKEKKQREEFEENVFSLIEETCTKLANSNK